MSLLYIGQQFTIYTGFCLLLMGVVGNGINVLVFFSVRTHRKTPSIFYFLMASIINIFYILLNLITRILSVGYGIDLTRTSSIWCKIRQFLLSTLGIVTLTYSCLAVIDQFLVTSRSAFLRRCSRIKWTYRIVFIVIILWSLHGIVVILFYDISPLSHTCQSNNNIFAIYASIYILGYNCALPISVMVIFGWLTYRNIHQTIVLAEQNVDRQLVKMTLLQVLLVIISLLPYGIYNAYMLITNTVTKDQNRQLNEYFAYTIVSMMAYLYYAGSCYIFLISSSRFRQAVKDRLLCRQRQNQIAAT